MKRWNGTIVNSSTSNDRVITIHTDREDEKALIRVLKTVGIEIKRYENNR